MRKRAKHLEDIFNSWVNNEQSSDSDDSIGEYVISTNYYLRVLAL